MVDVKQRIMEIQRLHAEKAAPVSPAVPQLGRSSPPALVARATAAMQEMARRRGTAPIVSTVASPEQSAVSTNVAAILSNEATPVGVRRFDATYTLPGSSERKTIRIAATDLNSAIAAVEAQLPGAVVIGAVEVTNSGVSAAANGPGDYLHDAIRRWIGASPSPDCACKARIAQMNAWGTAGCRVHLDQIVGWLENEAQKRGWWRFAVAMPGSRYFIRQMVLGAIEQAEVAEQALANAAHEQTEKPLSDPLAKGL